jgi:hypothetical protein
MVLESIRGTAHPADWRCVAQALPGALTLVDLDRRRRCYRGVFSGPPAQDVEALQRALAALGMGPHRAELLMGLTLQHLERKLGVDVFARLQRDGGGGARTTSVAEGCR